MPASIEPLSYSALDYLKSFGVVAIAVSPSGRVYVCRDPKRRAHGVVELNPNSPT